MLIIMIKFWKGLLYKKYDFKFKKKLPTLIFIEWVGDLINLTILLYTYKKIFQDK